MTDKIQVHAYRQEIEATFNKLKHRTDISKANAEVIKQFIDDCLSGRTVVNRQKKKVSEAGVRKYLFSMIVIAKHIGIDFDKIEHTNKDEPHIKDVVRRLENNSIKKDDGNPYSEKTKRDIKVTFRKFMKWLYGENINYPACVCYIDTSYQQQDVEALTREEIMYWANRVTTLRKKAIIITLFDSGARAEEFLNIRMKHVDYDKNEKAYRLRIEFSKTKPRTIYVPIATEILRQYIDSIKDKTNSETPLFSVTYNGLRKQISESSLKILDKRITAHGLRHSSCTYYADKLTPYQLCYRYGWTMSSNMPDRYIDRQGLIDKEANSQVRKEEESTLQETNRKMQEELHLLRQQVAEIMNKTHVEELNHSSNQLQERIKASKLENDRIKEVLIKVISELGNNS